MSDNTFATDAATTVVGGAMRAVDLFAAISDVLPFAGTDATLPMLTCIKLEASSDRMVSVTTDRFTLGARRVDYSGEAFEAMLWGADAKNLQRIAKTVKRDVGTRTVAIELQRRRVWQAGEDHRDMSAGTESGDVVALTFKFSTGEAITVQAADVQFPKWQHLIPTTDEITPADGLARLAYNPGYLAKFAKVSSDANHQMVLWTRPGVENKPLTVTIGTEFIGLIMPVRMPSTDVSGYARPSWVSSTV